MASTGDRDMHTETVQASDILRVNETVTLIVGQESEMSLFEARVMSIINGGVVLSRPVRVEGRREIESDLEVTFQVSRGGTVYQSESTVKSIQDQENGQVILSPPRSVRSVQRRDFVRLGFRRDVSFSIVPSDIRWRDWEDQLVWQNASTRDLSGSGMLLENAEGINEGDLLMLRMPFFDDIGIDHPVLAVCRRTSVAGEGSLTGVEFILGRSLGGYVARDDLTLLPRSAVRFDVIEQVKLSHFVLGRQIRMRQEKQQ